MEPRWRSRSLAAGCLVLLLGCWGPEEAVAAVSAGRPPCSPQALPGAAVPAGRGGNAEPGGGRGGGFRAPSQTGWLRVGFPRPPAVLGLRGPQRAAAPDRSPVGPSAAGRAGGRGSAA